MNLKHQTALAALVGMLTGRLLQNLPEAERAAWSRSIVAVLLGWIIIALALGGCTIEADGHKVGITPLPGWAWSYTGTTTNRVEVLR